MSALHKSICYCTNLRRSANAISDFYDDELKQTGLTIAQYYLLINLQRLTRANITHWADAVRLDRSTMVRNIKLLKNRSLIKMTVGHGKTFMLSQTGEESLQKAIPFWNTAQEKIKAILGEEDAEALLRINDKLQNTKMECRK